jgi:redox-sensing transcriptional repressor
MALYYSALKLMKADGVTVCISKDLGRLTGISPFNVRKDLAYFGEFGTKGVGYQTSYLLRRIDRDYRLQDVNEMRMGVLEQVGHRIKEVM